MIFKYCDMEDIFQNAEGKKLGIVLKGSSVFFSLRRKRFFCGTSQRQDKALF